MLERSAEIDDLAGRIFLAEHFCNRTIQAPEPGEPVGEVRIWMELNDFDQAPLAHTAGTQVVLRSALQGVSPDRCVAEVAMATPEGTNVWKYSTTLNRRCCSWRRSQKFISIATASGLLSRQS